MTTSSASGQGRVAPLPRLLSLALAAVLALPLSACGDEGEPVEQAGPNETANEPADLAPTATEQITAPRPSGVPTITGSQPAASVAELIGDTAELSTVASLLEESGVVGELDDGPYTVFAPTDEAFAALEVDPAALRDQQDRLAEILRMHIVSGRSNLGDLTDGEVLETLAGGQLEVQTDGDTVTVNGAEIVLPDIEAANGVVHGVGDLLIVLDEIGG